MPLKFFMALLYVFSRWVTFPLQDSRQARMSSSRREVRMLVEGGGGAHSSLHTFVFELDQKMLISVLFLLTLSLNKSELVDLKRPLDG